MTAISLLLLMWSAIGWRFSISHSGAWSTWFRAGKYQLANNGPIASLQWHQGLNAGNWPVSDGFSVHEFAGIQYDRNVGVWIPWWQVLTATALLPATWGLALFHRKATERRQAEG